MSLFEVYCRPENGRVVFPALLPDRDRFVALYGHQIRAGERITIGELSKRIQHEGGCKASGNDFVPTQADRDAFTLTAWLELMVFTEDHVDHFGCFPVEFFIEYEDIEYGYDASECLDLMGPGAVAHFQRKIEAMEEEAAS